MRKFGYGVLAAMVLAGCSDKAEVPEADSASASAVMTPGREAVIMAMSEGPEAFVRALYGAYSAEAWTPSDAGQEPVYSRLMNARLGADSARPGGSTLDYDPVCDCQDAGGLVLENLVIDQQDLNHADAAVSLSGLSEMSNLILKLVREGPNWKIDDVVPENRAALSETVMAGL